MVRWGAGFSARFSALFNKLRGEWFSVGLMVLCGAGFSAGFSA